MYATRKNVAVSYIRKPLGVGPGWRGLLGITLVGNSPEFKVEV
jgi:hypothetical protein